MVIAISDISNGCFEEKVEFSWEGVSVFLVFNKKPFL